MEIGVFVDQHSRSLEHTWYSWLLRFGGFTSMLIRSPSPSLQRTRTSRFDCGEFVNQWRLARAAHADCSATPSMRTFLCLISLVLLLGCSSVTSRSIPQ